MPDAFLRRVIAQRDREQLLDDHARMAHLNEITKPRPCRVCGAVVNAHIEAAEPATVCSACGGRKKQAQLEREDLARAAKQRRVDGLLQLAGITPSREVPMDAIPVGRTCARCGKKLRSHSQHDECFRCRTSQAGDRPGPKPKSATKKRFYIVAEAIGQDPDDLLESFMEGWLDKIRGSVDSL